MRVRCGSVAATMPRAQRVTVYDSSERAAAHVVPDTSERRKKYYTCTRALAHKRARGCRSGWNLRLQLAAHGCGFYSFEFERVRRFHIRCVCVLMGMCVCVR